MTDDLYTPPPPPEFAKEQPLSPPEPFDEVEPVDETALSPAEAPDELQPRRRLSLLALILAIAGLVLLIGAGGTIGYLAYDRTQLQSAFDDMAQAALTLSGQEESGAGQLIKRYVSNGQYSEAAAAMRSAAAEQAARGEAGPLGGIMGQMGRSGSFGGGGRRGPGRNGEGAPGAPGAAGAPEAGRGASRIAPDVLAMIPPEFRSMAEGVLGNLPPDQQRATVQRFLAGAAGGGGRAGGGGKAGAGRGGPGPGGGPRPSAPSEAAVARPPSAPPSPAVPSAERLGRRARPTAGEGAPSGASLAKAGPPALGGGPGRAAAGGPPTAAPGGVPQGTPMQALLDMIPPGVDTEMIRTLLASTTKPEDHAAASALAAFVLARQLNQADFDKFGQQLAQIMLAGLNTTTPATLAEMAKRFGPFLGGQMGPAGPGGRMGPGGRGPGFSRGGKAPEGEEPDEKMVREAIRELAQPYYAARGQGKDLSGAETAIDTARDRLYAGDYRAAMRAVRQAREALANLQ